MCTSIAINKQSFYFGRNLDISVPFSHQFIYTPRAHKTSFQRVSAPYLPYFVYGIGSTEKGYPLYAEAANEQGLCMAGLAFEGQAYYPHQEDKTKYNISPYELIPWLLRQCASVDEAEGLLQKTALLALPYKNMPLTPLHWHIADKTGSIVVEATADGMHIYQNPIGVLTNAPPFPYHKNAFAIYSHLTPKAYQTEPPTPIRLGVQAIGLPGDYTSPSRFIKAAWLLKNAWIDESNPLPIFFDILSAVSPLCGAVLDEQEQPHYTQYACCIDTKKQTYYYRTPYDLQIKKRDFRDENPDGTQLKYFLP